MLKIKQNYYGKILNTLHRSHINPSVGGIIRKGYWLFPYLKKFLKNSTITFTESKTFWSLLAGFEVFGAIFKLVRAV